MRGIWDEPDLCTPSRDGDKGILPNNLFKEAHLKPVEAQLSRTAIPAETLVALELLRDFSWWR